MDDEARRLKRALASGGPEERIRYAHVLERAGRRDEAVDVLVAGAEEAEVRRALGECPRWSELEANNRFADVKPIRKTPKLAWTAPRLETDGLIQEERLFASPLAVVYEQTRPARTDTVLLDPTTGDRRATLKGRIRAISDAVLVDRSFIEAFDLWTGKAPPKQRSRTTRARKAEGTLVAPPLVMSNGTKILAESADPLAPPGTVWEARGKGSVLAVSPGVVLELPDVAPSVRWLDRGTGKVRWKATLPGTGRALADERGVVAFGVKRFPGREGGQRWGIVAFDSGGREQWRTRQPTECIALTPERVLSVSKTTVAVLDRETGRILGQFDPPAPWRGPRHDAIAIARDVIYLGETSDPESRSRAAIGVQAYSLEGQLLWRVPVSRRTDTLGQDWIGQLVAAHGRLY